MNFTIDNNILKGSEKLFETGSANLGKLFLDALKSKPNFIGQIDANTGEEKTYGKMVEDSIRCGIWLKKHGIRFDDIVLTCSYNRMDTYIPILATFYNGATFAIGLKGFQPQRTRYFFSILRPKFIFTEEEEVKLFEQLVKEENLNAKIITFTKIPNYYYLNDILNESESSEVNEFSSLPPLNPNHDCILTLTSGTTGEPKILAHSYRAIMEGLLAHIIDDGIENEVSLVYFQLYWMVGLRVMLGGILNFTTRIVVDNINYDLHEAFQLIEKYKVTKVRFSLGMIYRIFKWSDLEKYDTSSIKTLTFNGVKLPPEMINFLMRVAKKGFVEQTYGTTEMSLPMCRGIMNKIDLNSCGYLYPNMSLKVIDVKSGKTVGPKEHGEICFKSPYLMKGYYKNQAYTEKVIDSEGWYHTGDLGYYENCGLVFILERVKNSTILPNGKIVPLWQVERALLLNSEVMETVVLSSPENLDSLKFFAFITVLPGSKITEKELSDIANNLGDIDFPIIVKIVDALPITSNGKVKLSELKEKMF